MSLHFFLINFYIDSNNQLHTIFMVLVVTISLRSILIVVRRMRFVQTGERMSLWEKLNQFQTVDSQSQAPATASVVVDSKLKTEETNPQLPQNQDCSSSDFSNYPMIGYVPSYYPNENEGENKEGEVH